MRTTPARWALIAFALSVCGSPLADTPSARHADLGEGVEARLEGTALIVSALARPDEDWDSLAARVLLDPAKGPALEAEAGGVLDAGREVRVPLRLWPAGLGSRALLALFPGDSLRNDGWHHVVTPGATAWSLAVLFIGSGARHGELRSSTGAAATCRAGETVIVPLAALRTELKADGIAAPSTPNSPPSAQGGTVIRGQGGLASSSRGTLEILRNVAEHVIAAARAPGDTTAAEASSTASEDEGPESPEPTAALQEASTLLEECAPIDADEEQLDGDPLVGSEEPFVVSPGSKSSDGVLRYASDAEGPHAVYRLKQGETLYSDVVLRFTGLLSGRDVNSEALRLAKRSGVKEVTNIPVGAAIRIPLADLLPQYLPTGHPRRMRWESEQAESTRLARRERRRNLSGVHVLIDAGHGGNDPGAGNAVVWEDDHAYDIACRVMAILRDHTAAKVHPLIRDRSSAHAPLARLRRDTDEDLLTTPPLRLTSVSTRVAVNTRWMLANDIRRRLDAQGVGDDRIVFLSIHADSLHQSATGAMAYYPSARLRAPSCGIPTDAGYSGFAEAREENAFKMTRREALRAEGLSRELGEAFIDSVRAAGLSVHGYSPVRGSIQRSGLMVPAVLKYNRVPAAVLLEAGNLNNSVDQKSLRDPVFRQDLAEALVAGLTAYFEGHDAGYKKAGGR